MKIVVCISHVPDTSAKIAIAPDGKTLKSDGIAYIINPYDEFAIEEALKIKEETQGEVIAVSLGTDANKDSLRKALAMGADSAILLKEDTSRDSFGVASALASEIKEHSPELVFFGKQSVDYDNSIVGQMTAELLGYNCISVVVDLKISANKIIAEREIEGGKEVVETTLPAVITAQKGLNKPRYASLKGMMLAKKRTIEEKIPAPAEQFVEVISMNKPTAKQAGKIVGEDAKAVPELVRLLKEEARVL